MKAEKSGLFSHRNLNAKRFILTVKRQRLESTKLVFALALSIMQ